MFKRVFQTKRSRRFFRPKIKTTKFFSKFYRLDADDNLNQLIQRPGAGGGRADGSDARPPKAGAPDLSSEEKMRYEYLRTVIRPPVFVSTPAEVRDDTGAAPNLQFWYIASAWTNNQHMKLVPTHSTEDDVPNSPFSVCAQSAEIWRNREDTFTVYFDADPEFLNSMDLACWDHLKNNLLIWKSEVSDVEKCFDLKDGAPLLRCP